MENKKISLADFVATLEFKGTDKVKQELKEVLGKCKDGVIKA